MKIGTIAVRDCVKLLINAPIWKLQFKMHYDRPQPLQVDNDDF